MSTIIEINGIATTCWTKDPYKYQKEYTKRRFEADPDFREAVRSYKNDWQKKRYASDPAFRQAQRIAHQKWRAAKKHKNDTASSPLKDLCTVSSPSRDDGH